ncbi:MAG TPA: Calx-beta domain-containing protein [Acidimicrobiales bacterium]|nr:Calx-beta domain-containing protein [Acidimicrobiales bacterium]
MSRNRKILIAAVVVAVAAGGAAVALVGRGSSSTKGEVIVFSQVQRRTLQDTVALNGTLARKQIRNITAATQGLMSAVYAKNGTFARAGQSMFAITGRDAIAENGAVPFFRPLAPGDQGDDVLQLKQILAAAGDDPGPMDNYFSQQTQFALAQWQAQHHYPNSTPATPESVTVSLEQGTGYKLGFQASAGLVIGPPAGAATTSVSTGGHAGLGTLTAVVRPMIPGPTLTIQSVNDTVVQGSPATFVITASQSSSSDITVNLTPGGTATSDDVVTPPTSAVLLAGTTSTSVTVQTRVNSAVEPDATIVLSIAAGSGYTVGSPGSAQTTIKNTNVPQVQISGATTISPGGSATLTVTANTAPLQDTQVDLAVSGSAVPGTDYVPVNPVVTLAAGSTSATVTVNSIDTSVIQPDKYVVVSITPSPTSYSVGPQGSAVVTISGRGVQPTLTLTSATTYLQKGQPYQVTIGLTEAISTPLTVNLTYGGTAIQGVDYTVPGGSIVVPAGQTSTRVAVPTVTSNTVTPDRLLTVSLAPSGSYQVGSPSSAAVVITSSVVPTLTISATSSTVPQGGAASFTITADQPPVKDTSVSFAVAGTAQPGQNYVPLAGTTTLKAGQTRVTVVLQSIQNNVTFEPTDMIVGEWPTRVGQVYLKAGAPVAPGEAVLALTEPVLSVTLQASAADRSKLAVGQRCTVQISGATTSGVGVITELDATPTVVSSGTGQSSQVYEGKIEVSNLDGADGSEVSITVVDQQVNDALTVPIAAVKQNGSGVDVVRVINLADGGRVTEVPVTTGLTEGSYIQITHGLREGQLVIAQVNQG